MEKYKEIERSIIKTYRKEIWSKFTKAINDYELIKSNDKIMVCISGGKDSFLLAKCIQELHRHGKIKFEAQYVVMNPGYSEKNIKLIKENAKKLNIPIEIFFLDNSVTCNNGITFISHSTYIHWYRRRSRRRRKIDVEQQWVCLFQEIIKSET